MRELIGRGLVDWGGARIDGERPGGLQQSSESLK